MCIRDRAMHVSPSLIGPEQRKVLDVAMKRAQDKVIPEAWKMWSNLTDRHYPLFIETMYVDDADYILVTMGAYSKDVEYVVKKLRRKKVKIGSIRLRYFRPFPTEELRKAVECVKAVGVVDFSFSLGSPDHGSTLFNEIKSALYNAGNRPILMDFIFSGGRETTITELEKVAGLLMEAVKVGKAEKPVRWLTVRGEDI